MMLSYDHLIDTREKRFHLMIMMFLSCALIYVIPYLMLGYTLVKTTSYASLYQLLLEPSLTMCYLSRVILDAMSLSSYDLTRILTVLFQNVGIMEIFTGVTLLLVLPVIAKKKKTTIALVILLGEAIVCMCLMSVALSSGTLSQAIVYIRIIGGVFILSHTILLFMLAISLYKVIKRYRSALTWSVEEIKE